MNVSRIGAAGALAAMNRFDASVQRVASGDADQPVEAVEQIRSKAIFDASMAVFETSGEMFEHMLDMKV